MTLIEISYHSCGKPRSAFVDADRLAVKQSGCVALFDSQGKNKKARWPGEFEWHKDMLNVANIIERGSPRLAKGWQERAEANHRQFWQEFVASFSS